MITEKILQQKQPEHVVPNAVMFSGHIGDWYTYLDVETLALKNPFQVFSFQLYLTKNTFKYIILKWLRWQEWRQKRKTMRQKVVEAKEETLRKGFHLFKYVINHMNVDFFFCVNSLHCFMWFLLYYLLHLFS